MTAAAATLFGRPPPPEPLKGFFHLLVIDRAKVREAEAKAKTAERILEVVVQHDRLVELPDLSGGGKPS